MTELDDVLRQSFARIAEPGDPAGVADAIRSRLAAGDTGAPAATSGFSSNAGWVVPWLFGGSLLAISGLVLGTSGLLDPFFSPEPAAHTVQLQATVDALDCPSGDPIATLAAGNRVLAIARSDDSAYLAVRNPYNTAATVWLPVAVVIADSGEAGIDSLPVDGCGDAVTTLVAPTAEPTVEPAPVPTKTADPTQPTPPTPPGPVADTTSPTLGKPTATPATGVCADDSWPTHTSVITINASDNVGVTGVSISWNGVATGSGEMTGGPSSWSYTFNPPSSTQSGSVTFVLQARDAAGNLSIAQQTSVQVVYQCIF